MRTSKDVVIRHDGVFTWNFNSIQNCPLVFESRNCILKEIVFINRGGSNFRLEKLNGIMDEKERISDAMKHYCP